jgi:hypothetical protein
LNVIRDRFWMIRRLFCVPWCYVFMRSEESLSLRLILR